LYFPNICFVLNAILSTSWLLLLPFFRISMGGIYGLTMPLRGQVAFGVAAVVVVVVMAVAVVMVVAVMAAAVVMVVVVMAAVATVATMAIGATVAMEVVVLITVLQVELEGALLLEEVIISLAATSALTVVLVEILLVTLVLPVIQLAVTSYLPVLLVTTLAVARMMTSWVTSSRTMSQTAMPTREARESLLISFECQLNLVKNE
jgi:hypothetical protein